MQGGYHDALKKFTALFLAMAITLTFMPSMVFAETTAADGKAVDNEAYEPVTNAFFVFSKDGTDAEQNGNTLKIGWDYVFTADSVYEPVISKAKPYDYEMYLLIQVEDKADTYRVLTPEEVLVTDMKGNLVDFEVTKADEEEYGKIKISFTKAGKYQILGTEERDGVKEYYPVEINLTDDNSIAKTVNSTQIKGVSVTAKRGSQTVKWKKTET